MASKTEMLKAWIAEVQEEVDNLESKLKGLDELEKVLSFKIDLLKIWGSEYDKLSEVLLKQRAAVRSESHEIQPGYKVAKRFLSSLKEQLGES